MRYIGVHVSIAGGMDTSFDRAKVLKINAMQIFLKSASRWKSPSYSLAEIKKFKEKRKEFKGMKIYAHNSYLINLAGDGDFHVKSMVSMEDELNRADTLGVEFLVIHPGSHKGNGEIPGIKKIAVSLDKIFDKAGNTNVKILLENTSGQGTSIGYKLEHLRDIIGLSKYSHKILVCLDTCHLFAAGYDFTSNEKKDKFLEETDKIIGLGKIGLIHLNDSKKELSSRVDRHDDIGAGLIKGSGLKPLLNDERVFNIPLILETPKFDEYESDRQNLRRVYRLIRNKK